MIDHDPSEHGPRFTAGDGADLLAALAKVAPGIADAPTLWRPSASSCIWRTDADGNPVEELKGCRGQRLLPVRPRRQRYSARRQGIVRTLVANAGLRLDTGRRAGQLLMRSIVDASVWQPERLDFCGGLPAGKPCPATPRPHRSQRRCGFSGYPDRDSGSGCFRA